MDAIISNVNLIFTKLKGRKMKIKLLIIGAALSVFLLNAQATDLFECIKEAEIWLKSSYSENPVTLKVGLERLEKIGASSLSDEEKVQEIKNKFPKAFEKISAEDAFKKGFEFFNQENYAEAARWYRKAAEQGNVAAQYYLGVCYASGQGVPQDYAEAVKWYRKAAEQGYAKAQYNLGVCYDNGQGVPQDYAEAVKWYRKAAEQGLALAQYNLGICYDNGQGVPQDYAEATKWYRKAAEQGVAAAQYNLGDCYKKGQGVPQDYAEAVKWYRKAAEQGQPDAIEALKNLGEN